MLYRVHYILRRTDRIFASLDIEAPDDATAIVSARSLATRRKNARFEVWDDRRLVHKE